MSDLNHHRSRSYERIHEIVTAVTEHGPLPYADLVQRLSGVDTPEHVGRIVARGSAIGVLNSGPDTGDLPRGLTKGRANATHYVEIDRAAGCVVGLNIGRTYFSIGASDPNGHLLSTVDAPPKKPRGKAREAALAAHVEGQVAVHDRIDGVNGRTLFKRVAEETIKWLEKVKVPEELVRGITLSLPAPVSTTESKVLTTSIEKGLGTVGSIEVEFRRMLGSSRYPNLEKVIVANDADVAARGEVRYGEAYGKRDVVVINAAYGVGAGIVVDGRVLRTGAGGGAGEIGHAMPRIVRDQGAEHGLVPLDPNQECKCGCLGHLEALAGGEAIIKRLAASLDEVSVAPPDKLGKLLKDPNSKLSDALDALLEAISGPRPWEPGLEATLDAAHLIGGAAHTLTHLLKPEAIYLCGKLSEAGAPFLEMVEEGFSEPGSLQNYPPSIDLGRATSQFGRRLIMVRGAAMTAVRGTKPLITKQMIRERDAEIDPLT